MGGLPVFAPSVTMEWRHGVRCLELMTDPPRVSPRHDFTYSVRVGSPRIDEVSQTTSDIPVYQVILNKEYRSHQYWSWVGRANDIGLLKLAWAVTYNKYVWPICLPGLDFEVKDGSFCTVTGWGLPRVNGESRLPQTGWGGGVREDPGAGWVLPWTDVSETPSCRSLLIFPLGVLAVSASWPFRP